MSARFTGGPAFPVEVPPNERDRAIGLIPIRHLGLSIRDHFAAKAMQAIYTGLLAHGSAMTEDDDAAATQRAYQIADAMLAERSKP